MYKETAIQSSFFTKSTLQCWLVYWMLYSELAVQWGSQAKLPIWQLKKSRCGLSGTIFFFQRIMNSLAHTLLIFFIFGIRFIKIAWVCQKKIIIIGLNYVICHFTYYQGHKKILISLTHTYNLFKQILRRTKLLNTKMLKKNQSQLSVMIASIYI